MSRTKDPIKALWKLDHTICMNANAGTIQFDIDKESDYNGEGYDPEDTDCKDVVEAVEYIDLIEQTLKERKPINRLGFGEILTKFNRFLEFVDVCTKLHLNELKDFEGLKEYRQLRDDIEDYLAVLEVTSKAPEELGFVQSCETYADYVKTYTDIGGSLDEVAFTEDEFNFLKDYYYRKEEEVKEDDTNN